jgi:hypothetical protein
MSKSSFYIRANISDEVYKAISNIGQYDDKTRENLKKIIKEKTDLVFTNALSKVNIHTGNLSKSIHHDYSSGANLASGKVYADAPHGHLLEFGHKGGLVLPVKRRALSPGADGWFMHRVVVPYQQAHPFMKPALDQVRPTIEDDVKAVITHD